MVIRNVLQVFHTYKKEQVYHEKKNHNGSGDSCSDSGGSCDCINSGTDTGIDMTEGEEEKCPYRLSEMILQK